ncbi:MAG TPA: hypothetical protein VN495_04085 [Candidatus Paceibacterota bacterium]|nr:hypothetical protein [Candidatus Paceibacterota bacterium]
MSDHYKNPELWFRPSPHHTLEMLRYLIDVSALRATLRLGERTYRHPRGYFLGQDVTLRLFDGKDGEEVLRRPIRVVSVVDQPLMMLTGPQLAVTRLYSAGWKAAQSDLSYFAERTVEGDETVTLIEFYFSDAAGRARIKLDHPNLVLAEELQ